MNTNLKTAIAASIEAGKAIMEIYDSPFAVEYKDDDSPLTEADKQANDIINRHLLESKIPIISEENRRIDYNIRKYWNSCWVVDPVDGTKEFVKRNGEFTVNIALVVNGKPKLGVIYVPAQRVIYFGDVENKGSYKAEVLVNDEVELIVNRSKSIKPREVADIICIVGSRSHMNSKTVSFVEAIKDSGRNTKIISKGSSLKFCLVAEGKADVYPRFAPTMEWDTAAGQAICNAVGVRVVSQATKKEMVYNKENLLNPEFVVSI